MATHSKGLSYRAQVLLAVVCEHTVWDGDELRRYFVPRSPRNRVECELFPKESEQLGVLISGAGDASAFKALESRGLIKAQSRTGSYSYSATEDGMLAYEEIRSRLASERA